MKFNDKKSFSFKIILSVTLFSLVFGSSLFLVEGTPAKYSSNVYDGIPEDCDDLKTGFWSPDQKKELPPL